MGHYDPQYGMLLTSKEVSDLTGFTINQLRNFRQRGNSPIHFLSDGNTSWYRESDVIRYIETNGTKKMEYHVTGDYEAAPLTGAPADVEARKHVADMAKILTRNAWSKWTETLTQHGGLPHEEAYQFLLTETVRLYELKHGENLNDLYPGQNMDFWLRKNDPLRFWEGRTYATRSLARKLYGWNVTDLDIINTPIGDNPPAKID